MQQEFNDPLWRTVLSGAQMLFVAFGALVLMPLITGLDPNVALFTAGLGTILFQVVTGRQVPVFLASSFAFITPIILAKGQFGLAATMGGVMAAGFVYTFLGLAVKIKGTGFIDRLLPPVVIGPVIISIGLAMAPIAANMAMGKAGDGSELIHYQTAMLISMPALLTTLIVAVFGKGIFRLVPIISGVFVGFAMSFYFGVVDTAKIAAAPWFAIPHFTAPEFNWQAILFIVPVALAPAIEHIGGVIAVGSVTGRDYLKKPGLHRTLLGDGIATTAAGLFGGPPNTTYAEVTGAVMLTKNYNPKIMTWAAIFAISLAFIGKFGALLQSIPVPVMGGILCLLFGSIAAVGMNTLIRHKIDLGEARNLVIVSVTLVFGIGGVLVGTGTGPDDFGLKGIALCAVVAIALNLILPGNDSWKHKKAQDPLLAKLLKHQRCSFAQRTQRLRPLRIIVEARHQHQLLPSRFAELLQPPITDFFQRLDAIGHERRAHHQHLFHAAFAKLIQASLGVGFNPLGAPKARLERHRPFAVRQSHAFGEFGCRAQALGAVAGRQNFWRSGLAAISAFEAMVTGRVDLAQVPLR